jgi:hypothetical protein
MTGTGGSCVPVLVPGQAHPHDAALRVGAGLDPPVSVSRDGGDDGESAAALVVVVGGPVAALVFDLDPCVGVADLGADGERSAVAAGRVPSIRAIRSRLRVGQPRAQQVRAYLAALGDG